VEQRSLFRLLLLVSLEVQFQDEIHQGADIGRWPCFRTSLLAWQSSQIVHSTNSLSREVHLDHNHMSAPCSSCRHLCIELRKEAEANANGNAL
jgi:hypothetical protein